MLDNLKRNETKRNDTKQTTETERPRENPICQNNSFFPQYREPRFLTRFTVVFDPRLAFHQWPGNLIAGYSSWTGLELTNVWLFRVKSNYIFLVAAGGTPRSAINSFLFLSLFLSLFFPFCLPLLVSYIPFVAFVISLERARTSVLRLPSHLAIHEDRFSPRCRVLTFNAPSVFFRITFPSRRIIVLSRTRVYVIIF